MFNIKHAPTIKQLRQQRILIILITLVLLGGFAALFINIAQSLQLIPAIFADATATAQENSMAMGFVMLAAVLLNALLWVPVRLLLNHADMDNKHCEEILVWSSCFTALAAYIEQVRAQTRVLTRGEYRAIVKWRLKTLKYEEKVRVREQRKEHAKTLYAQTTDVKGAL
jgi:hypothetical protein